MSQNLTWIDVSHILGWPGNLTGIERVEYHLIEYYYHHTDAGFVSWNNKKACFEILPRKEIASKIIQRTSEKEQFAAPQQVGLLYRTARKLRRELKPTRRYSGGRLIVLAGLWDNKDYIKGLQEVAKQNPLVHVIFDMIPLVQTAYVVDWLPGVYGDYMFAVLPVCSQLLSISESTAQDTKKLLEERKLPVPDIATFRLGDDITRAGKAEKPRAVPSGSFFLSVGTIEARKNHVLLLDVYRQAIQENIDLPPIVLVGRRGWLTDDFQKAVDTDPDIKGKIIILDKTTDAELRWLYENCLLTVFASFYEGWGLPVAESLNYGKIALSSNTSSMPEVGGVFADYFSPDAPNELLGLLVSYLDPKVRSKREAFIRKDYKPLAWNDAAKKFASLVK
jgi:glycosyltransferase involved in cell wall biosynthesis